MLMTLNFYRTTNKGTDLNNFFRFNQCPLDHCVLDVGPIYKVRFKSDESSVARMGKILPFGLLFVAGGFDSQCSGPEII